MNQGEHPRLSYLDQSWLRHFISKYEPKIIRKLQDIKDGVKKARQTQYALLYHDLLSLALVKYAAGEKLTKVRLYMREALQIYLAVLGLRGSESSGRIDIPLLHEPRRPLDIGEALSREQFEPVDDSDYSLGNSRTSLQAMYFALSGGEFEITGEIAKQVWDPVDAEYIGIGSEVCSPNDQRLAYALRNCLQGDMQAARDELTSIFDPIPPIEYQKRMLLALVDNNGSAFLNALAELLDWHRQEATEDGNHKATECFICIPGLGLSAYGWWKGVISPASLPKNNMYLPIQLFTAA